MTIEPEAKSSRRRCTSRWRAAIPVVASDTTGISEVVEEFGCAILTVTGDSACFVA